ncbi:hypothetical protein RHMOL_Rhmol04G0310100 [Rhododendron molle]|nr:hypothetical protein RHMOL_Rhmol04G0310100 [Rhododendron molle]
MDPNQNMNPESEILEDDDDVEEPTATPLWKYVTKISGQTSSKGGSGGSKFICNFGCKLEPYTGSYSRVRAHLIGILPGQKAQGVQLCPMITKTEREMLKQEEIDATRIFGGNAKARKLSSIPPALSSGNQSKSPSPVKFILDEMFNISSKEDVDQRIARCLYGNGVPFNVVRSPLWADMVAAINSAPKGYKSPNYEKVRTTLLDKEQNKVRQALSPLMQDWSTHGVSIISDGWSNIKNQHLINIMAVSGGKAIFISGHDVSSVEKNATNIAELLFKAIDYVGPSNVIQVVTDNAANCKAAGAIIQRKFNHIFWSGCLAHTLNLLMKDIAKSEHPSLSFVDETYKRGKAVVKYIKNHSACQSLFKSFSSLELTRFGHHFIVIQRLVKVRASLVSMALSKQWDCLKRTTSSPEQHDNVQQTVLDDDFWRKSQRVLKITKPIYKMLRFSDTDQPIIGEVYEQMDTMLGNIKDTLSADPIVCDLIHELVEARWDKMNIPLHCLAYVLVPKYYTNSWLSNPAPGGVRRRKPHTDSEVQRGYLEAIDKIVVDRNEAAVIRLQISDFVSNKGVFSQPQAVTDRANMSALSWWHLYGGVAPELFSLALKVLSQIVNTSCAERCWSTYSFIHTVKRNRLNVDRAEKLVFVHYNHRLLSRYRDDYENFKNWDANPEEPNIEEDLAALEERERVSLPDSEDEAVPIPQQQLTIGASGSAPPCSTSSMLGSSSSPSPSNQVCAMEQAKAQARKRIEKAKGKRQKK